MATYRQGHPEPRGQGRWPPAGGAGQRPAPSPAGPLWPRLCRPGSDRRRAGAPAPAAGTGQAKPSCPALLGRYPMDPSEAGQRERNPGLWEGLQIHWRPGAGPGGAPSPEGRPGWRVTNGLGGFACGTVPGLPTRRYHGWLVAAVAPPVDRRLLWAATEEWVRTPHGDWPLSTYDYGDTWHPDGWKHLAGWRRYPFPSWVFQAGGVLLERRLFMVRGQNTTVACYRLLAGPGVELSLKPLINCRDYHH